MEPTPARPLRSSSLLDSSASHGAGGGAGGGGGGGGGARHGWKSLFGRLQSRHGHSSNEALEAEIASAYTAALDKLASNQPLDAKTALLKVKKRFETELDPHSTVFKELQLATLKNLGRVGEALLDFEFATANWVSAIDCIDGGVNENNDDVCVWLGVLRCARATHRDSLVRMAADRVQRLRPDYVVSTAMVATSDALPSAATTHAPPATVRKAVKPTWVAVLNAIVSSLNDDLLEFVVLAPSALAVSTVAAAVPLDVAAPAAPAGPSPVTTPSKPKAPDSPTSQSSPQPAPADDANPTTKRARRAAAPKPASTAASLDDLVLPLADLAGVEAARMRFEARLAQYDAAALWSAAAPSSQHQQQQQQQQAPASKAGLDEAQVVRAFCSEAPQSPFAWLARAVAHSAHIPDAVFSKCLQPAAKPLLRDEALWVYELAEAQTSTYASPRARRLLGYALLQRPPAYRPKLATATFKYVAERARVAGEARLAEAALDALQQSDEGEAVWVSVQRALIGMGVQAKSSLEGDGALTAGALQTLFAGFDADFDSLKRSPELLDLALRKCRGDAVLECAFAELCADVVVKAMPFAGLLQAAVDALVPVAGALTESKGETLVRLATCLVASPASNAAVVTAARTLAAAGAASHAEHFAWLDEAVAWVCATADAKEASKETRLKALLAGGAYFASPLRLSYPFLMARHVRGTATKSLLVLAWLAKLGESGDYAAAPMSEQQWFALMVQVCAACGQSEALSLAKLEALMQPRLHRALACTESKVLADAEATVTASLRAYFPSDKQHAGLLFQWLAPYLWTDDVDGGPTRAEQAQWLERLLKLDAGLADGPYLTAQVLKRGAADDARKIALLERDLELNPWRVDSLVKLGDAYWYQPDGMAKSAHYWTLFQAKMRAPGTEELRAGSIAALHGSDEPIVVARVGADDVDVVTGSAAVMRFVPRERVDVVPGSVQHLEPGDVDACVVDAMEFSVAAKLRLGPADAASAAAQFGLERALKADDARAWEFAVVLGDLPRARELADGLAAAEKGREYAAAHVRFLQGDARGALEQCATHLPAAVALQRADAASDALAPLLKDLAATQPPLNQWLIVSDQAALGFAQLRKDAAEARARALKQRGDVAGLLELAQVLAKQRVSKATSDEERAALKAAAEAATTLEAAYTVWISLCEARLGEGDELRQAVEASMVALYRGTEGASETADLDATVRACAINFPELEPRAQKGRSKLKLMANKRS